MNINVNEIMAFLESIENAIKFQIDELQATLAMVKDEHNRYAGTPVIVKRLVIPWLSQLSQTAAYGRGDCGAAGVAMLLQWKGKTITVDDVSKATGKVPGYTLLGFPELILAAITYGLNLVHQNMSLEQVCAEIDDGQPVLCLVNYRSLPATMRFDGAYNSGHYILVVGYDENRIVYHDPYWRDETGGAYKAISRAEFWTAFSTIAPRNSFACHALRVNSVG
jgi:uncharacterized protein YvpB